MGFEDATWLFTCGKENRGHVRLDFNEAGLLWKYVKKTTGNILEIGRYMGGSTALLLLASHRNRLVVSIDLVPRDYAPDIVAVFKQNAKRLTLLHGKSQNLPVDIRFGLIFVDGDHSYDGVSGDIRQHWGALEDGGYMLFHDYMTIHPGVMKACDELLATSQAKLVEQNGSMIAIKKGALCTS